MAYQLTSTRNSINIMLRINEPGFDIVTTLREAYNHIENSGFCEKEFLKGWLCPIYKKKDCCELANYCLITVLNAEYKIFTSALMEKLSLVAPKLIHKCQATFMKK